MGTKKVKAFQVKEGSMATDPYLEGDSLKKSLLTRLEHDLNLICCMAGPISACIDHDAAFTGNV